MSDKKFLLTKAAVEYQPGTNVFAFSKQDEKSKINVNGFCMLKLIEALTEIETSIVVQGDPVEIPNQIFLAKNLQENTRLRLTLELSVFNGKWYIFLKQYYIPSRDVTGSAEGNGYKDISPQVEIVDERILAFMSALKMKQDASEEKKWLPARGSVQLCLQDINPLVEFATEMIRNY